MNLIQRKQWNENHKKLTNIILKSHEHHNAIALFLHNHSWLHAGKISLAKYDTLEDVLLKDLNEQTFRKYPVAAPDTKNSIAWHLWHVTRIEDMTMNTLVDNNEQLFFSDEWYKKLKVEYLHTGNEMTEDEVADLSSNIEITALLAYRSKVGSKTREIVSRLEAGDLKQKVDVNRIKTLQDQNAVKREASWLLEYWSNKSIAGLLLMPATRHIYLHLNKSIRLKQKMQKSRIRIRENIESRC